MSPLARNIVNLVIFNAAWFACVLGAAKGVAWLPPLGVAVSVGIYMAAFSRDRMADLKLFAGSLAIGFGAETVLAASGLVRLESALAVAWIAPPWIVLMYANLATTLHVSLSWMKGRWILCAVFGLLGGPLAYFSGSRLGAIAFDNLAVGLAAVGVAWAIAFPLMVLVAERTGGGAYAAGADGGE